MGVSRRAKVVLSFGVAIGVASLGAALAETAAAQLPAAVQRILDCRTQPDPARLACYDAAVGEFARLIGTGELVVVDHERIAKVKRQAFGFSLPSLNLFERSEKPVELEQISGTVARAHRRAAGAWVIELDDGAVWEQVDALNPPREPRAGSKVEVRKAAMGSFFMNIDGQRAIRVQRMK